MLIDPITKSLMQEFQDLADGQPFWIMTAEQAPSLSLRIYPVDVILLTHKQTQTRMRVYLVDMLFTHLPKRVAVIYWPGETLRDLTRRLGLEPVCNRNGHHCLLRTSFSGAGD